MDRRAFLMLAGLVTAGGITGCTRDTAPSSPARPSPGRAGTLPGSTPHVVATVASGLSVPWGLAFSDEHAWVSERDSGRILRLSLGGEVMAIGKVTDIASDTSEGGLLGLALHPEDPEYIFAYLTTSDDNRVVGYSTRGSRLRRDGVVLSGIPRASHHNGGRLAIGPDLHLYVTTGDAGDASTSQDRGSLGGKILKLDLDGRPADGNPFDNEVWSYGHRNVQGLAFDAEDRLWASEFGQDRLDELNLIEGGGNYGWPEAEGASDDERYVDPKVTWTPEEASPAGMTVVGGAVLLAALRGRRLWSVPLDGDQAGEPQAHLTGEHGRLRTIANAPDGSVWLTTSNHDGRGDPRTGDDRILRLEMR